MLGQVKKSGFSELGTIIFSSNESWFQSEIDLLRIQIGNEVGLRVQGLVFGVWDFGVELS